MSDGEPTMNAGGMRLPASPEQAALLKLRRVLVAGGTVRTGYPPDGVYVSLKDALAALQQLST